MHNLRWIINEMMSPLESSISLYFPMTTTRTAVGHLDVAIIIISSFKWFDVAKWYFEYIILLEQDSL